MGLISQPTSAPTPTLTTAQKQMLTRARLKTITESLFARMLAVYQEGMTQVWQNPRGLSAQEVLDALGTDAGDLFRLAALLKQAINAALPGTIADVATPAVTINADGTVTVTQG